MSEQDSGALRVEIEREIDLATGLLKHGHDPGPLNRKIGVFRRCLVALAVDPALERPDHAANCPVLAAWDIPDACNCGGKYREPDEPAQGEREQALAAHDAAMARDFPHQPCKGCDAQPAALTALAAYTEHKSYCSKWRNSGDFWHRTPYIDSTLSCNCGLDAVLAEAEQEAK